MNYFDLDSLIGLDNCDLSCASAPSNVQSLHRQIPNRLILTFVAKPNVNAPLAIYVDDTSERASWLKCDERK